MFTVGLLTCGFYCGIVMVAQQEGGFGLFSLCPAADGFPILSRCRSYIERRDTMPMRPNVPCGHPGCPRLVPYGKHYCEQHEAQHRGERPGAGRRGYDRKWQKARLSYLRQHPYCVCCMKEGKMVEATVVDHIRPHRGNHVLFWDKNNWQSLCKPCHDRKTWNEDANPEYRF